MFQFVTPVGTQNGLKATCAKISPDGQFLAITQGLNILIYDINRRTVSQTLVTSHARPFSELCWSPDGQCIATASDDFSVEIIHLSYGLLHTFIGHTAPVISLTFNRKGNLLFTSSMDESIKIWDTLNGSLMKTISAHSEAVVSVDVPMNDSSILSSGSYDGLIRIFDAETGHCLKTLTYDKDWKRENGVVPISQVKFSENARYLLVKSLDGVVKIWDCIGGCVVRTFQVQPLEKGVLHHSCGMDFLNPEDGSTPLVISGYENGDIYCWNSDTKSLLQLLDGSLYHHSSPVMSIHCFGNIMCSLALNGDCCLWRWV
ncbi:AQG_2a_G0003920.mRNA.1.CDS.1 [Saccharomyces cerevisiae]|uniref:COMPASS component SWD3 n=4 Tax=Saccharomyces cerevisiae TaxID=4932 RepID=SWD3_YEAST|nr:Swd3p [Saccharomyces cerevisiae S288C]P38123.1 RecName: Full=COMPASS component SWD3; AltName: Full=Complex proteins associated with SET1 protein SWD3; AltName: Full=Set1C component SWD3 [Saccharomyces cerevisiae S288C]6VEN_L Chain L, COMPASS component SWD3 [Saccharomyces cerevisiae]AJP82146.1 Swd3p [Saccharomyces cerevisiae YJM1402]AJP83315.1 Swd3p [Saccharomyces cerevisiae YJM1418]AJP84464.1 Swd3p [Saccharomyces cerevisiae YJM1434]AJP84851.1 Swd3p [Saccharomyces cerevisiae YJM1439]AJP859|eukprot:NP_009734.1 Swd3p [Saccharomyces cerevisiae S288C]